MAEETQTKTQLPDAEDLGTEDQNTPEKREQALVSLWTKRFKQAEEFRRPYIARNLRMYKLYRAYRDASNYAYGTNLMPPTGFEIIETIKPRLASSQMKVNIYPRDEANRENPDSIERWDDLVEYDLQEMGFDDEKILWINAQLMFGNGVAQIYWEGKTPGMEIVDNWLFYPDPKAQNRLKNSRWEIKQSFKSKAVIEQEEKERGDNPLYSIEVEVQGENGPVKEVKALTETKKWKEEIKDEQPTGDDPRRDRYQINTLKMGQIDDGRQKKSDIQPSHGEMTTDKESQERTIEIWECWDHVTNKLQVIMNRKYAVRDEENPYLKVNKGQVFIDLPDISLNWEYYAMGHLEPVETTIHEIADSRNQAMDDIVFSLDPIRKVKKGKGYKTEDLKHAPGATWYLAQADDVTFERMPEVTRAWVEKDNLLRREVQSSLALSEYTQGSPNSSQEPASKVEVLLMQSNIRLALIVRQMEIAITDLVNAIIEMNQQFLEENLAMRILGKNFRFAEFKSSDKEIGVDAYVTISPKQEKAPGQEAKEVLEMYKLFVVDDKPEGGDEDTVARWEQKKNLLQKLIVEKLGYEEYVDILAPKYQKPKPAPTKGVEAPAILPGPAGAAENPGGPPPIESKPEQALPMLPKEGMTAQPGAQTPETAAKPNVLKRLFQRIAGRQ